MREAIGGVFGLDPDRIVCGAGSDDLLNLLARAYLTDGDEAIHTTHGFLVYPIATLGTGAKPVVAPEKNFTADVDAILKAVTPNTKIVFLANPNNPTGTYVPFDEVKRLHRGAAGRTCCWCSTPPMPNMSGATITSPASSWSRPADNVVMTRTFSKIYGLAALRLGWMYGPAHVVDAVNRIRGPFNVNAPAIAAGIAAITRQRACRARARAQCEMAAVADRGDRQARPEGDAERRQFRADPFSRPERPHAKDADAFLMKRGLILRQVGAYKLPNALRMTVGSEEANRLVVQGAQRVPGENGVTTPAPLFNRLALIGVGLIGSSIARAARAQSAARSIVATARSPATRRRVAELGIADQVVETNAAAVEGADLVIVCIPVGACGAVAKEIAAASGAPARSSPMSARSKARFVRDMGPHLPNERALRAGASGGRHRIFRARRRLCRAVRQPLVHFDAADKAPIRRPSTSSPRSGALLGANVETMVGRSPRPGARHHQPSAASDRLHHRRHRRRIAER